MRKDRSAVTSDAFERMANPYVDDDDYTIDCGELDDTEFPAAGRELRHGDEEY